MSTEDWQKFRKHHVNNWAGRDSRYQTQLKQISAAWRHLDKVEKSAEVARIDNRQGRSLAEIRNKVFPSAAGQVAPPVGQPAVPTAPSVAQSINAPTAADAPTLPKDNGSEVTTEDEEAVENARNETTPEDIFGHLLQRDSIIKDFPPEDHSMPELARWVGGWSLGGRSENNACIWFRFDDQDNLIERIVIKDVVPRPQNWVDMTRWQGDPRDLPKRIPVECMLLNRLAKSDGAQYFINMRAFRNFADRHMYRMLLDFCDEDNAKEIAKGLSIGRGRLPPEPFFWRILEHLVQAAIVMEQGSLLSVQEGWQQIVHCDFKADNVFMTSTPNCYYPRALVSDLEFAIETSANDIWNPKVYRNHVTGVNTGAWFCQPYEATPDEDINNESEPRPEGLLILSPANVWCIGITMFQIMNGGEPRLKTKTHFTYASDDLWYSWKSEISKLYSAPLVDMISKCLSIDPSARPSLAQLRDFVTNQNLNNDFAQACRSARNPATENDISRDDWKYRRPMAPYKLGMSHKDVIFYRAQVELQENIKHHEEQEHQQRAYQQQQERDIQREEIPGEHARQANYAYAEAMGEEQNQ